MKILVILFILAATVETTKISVLYNNLVSSPIKRFFKNNDASHTILKTTNPTSHTTESNKINLFSIIRDKAYEKLVPSPIKRLFEDDDEVGDSQTQIEPKESNPEENKFNLFGRVASDAYEKFVPSPIKHIFHHGDDTGDADVESKASNYTPEETNSNFFSRVRSDAYEKLVPSPIKHIFQSNDYVNDSQIESNAEEEKLSLFSRVTNDAYERFVPPPVKHFFNRDEPKKSNDTSEEGKSGLLGRVASDAYEKLVPSPIKNFFNKEGDSSSPLSKSKESNSTPSAAELGIFSRAKNSGLLVYETFVPLPIKRLLLSKDSENEPEMNSTTEKSPNSTFLGRVTNGVYEKFVPTPIKRIFQSDEKNKSEPEINNSTFFEKVTNNGIYKKLVPESVQKFFTNEDNKNESASAETPNVSKEHGNLDFFGRDIVKNVGKTITKIGNKFTRSSKGLDSDKGFFEGIIDGFKNKVRAVVPGTLWCGDGDVADDKRELGLFYVTDNCCREHDNCRDSMLAGEIRNGLENTGLFTRSNCECDVKFYSCLKLANSIISSKIGSTYFTVLGPQCFKIDYPVIRCVTISRKRCIEYEYDTTKDKYEQWFDNPTF